MNKEQFNIFCTTNYPNTIPVSHLFKWDHKDKWLRVHSLPKSKRYAETDDELNVLLSRQNQIISDLFGERTEILIITGEFNWGKREGFLTDEEEVFKPYDFIQLDHIDLHEFDSELYDRHEIYRPAFSESRWVSNHHDKLLIEIAEDNVRALLISIESKVIIAPYDGGMDLFFNDIKTRDFYKHRYKEWLSERVDGL